jgi:hypothetical protein
MLMYLAPLIIQHYNKVVKKKTQPCIHLRKVDFTKDYLYEQVYRASIFHYVTFF